MKKYQFILLIACSLISFLIPYSCEKGSDIGYAGKEIEIYILNDYKTENAADIIDNSTVVLNEKPLITYNEIISYNKEDYTFEVNESAIDKLNEDGGLKYHFKAFAVTVDKSIIYTGYFWPAYSSSIKQWFVIDPILYSGENKLRVGLAYPTDAFAGTYQDKRNDIRIINVLKRDGKLKD
jgi:hypothetical protein